MMSQVETVESGVQKTKGFLFDDSISVTFLNEDLTCCQVSLLNEDP